MQYTFYGIAPYLLPPRHLLIHSRPQENTREVQEISNSCFVEKALRLSRTDAAMLCGHAWAGAAHPGPAAVLCGQPVIAAHMLSADDW